MQENPKVDLKLFIGQQAAWLSLVEIGLGSFLHAFKIPLSGHCLSLNQGFMLTRAAQKTRYLKRTNTIPLSISTTTALLKSLAPAGKKLTPMLALAMQGLLYNLGILFFGNNLIGQGLGIMLLSLWAFVQPLLIYYLLFGKDLLFMLHYYLEKLSELWPITQAQVLHFLLGLVLIKLVLSLLILALATGLSDQRYESYQAYLLSFKRAQPHQSLGSQNIFWLAFKDLFNPLFVVSLILTLLFFYFSESSHAQLIWAALRPIAVGYLLFLLIRYVPLDETRLKSSKWQKYRLVQYLQVALSFIRASK